MTRKEAIAQIEDWAEQSTPHLIDANDHARGYEAGMNEAKKFIRETCDDIVETYSDRQIEMLEVDVEELKAEVEYYKKVLAQIDIKDVTIATLKAGVDLMAEQRQYIIENLC